MPGTQNVALFEAFRTSGLRTVLTTHELGAAFMAGGYARASGRVGVVAAIPGPGFTYTLTGLAEALLDSTPLVVLTGIPARAPGKRFQLQAIDQAGIAGPLAKRVVTVEQPGEVAEVVAEALDFAQSDEPGPVIVQLDERLLSAEGRAATPRVTAPADAAAVAQGVRLFLAARRPVILAGQGCATAAGAARLERLIGGRTVPVVTTPSGRGVVPEDHPLALRHDGQSGGFAALNALLESSDLVLVLGAKLSHNGTGGFELRLPADRLVQVDTSAEVMGANYPCRLAVRADAAAFLDAILAAAPGPGTGWTAAEVAQWRERLRPGVPADPPEPAIHGVAGGRPAALFAALRRALPRDAIVVTDSGLHQSLVRRHYDVLAPRGLLLPSDFQSMGFGVPAAVGAALGAPDRRVVAVVGDGGFLMTGLELLTAVRERVPVTVIVFNDGRLNLIRLQQYREFGHAHAVDLTNPDFAALAGALGAGYVRLEGDVPPEATLRSALSGGRPTLVEVLVGDSAAIHTLRARALAKGAVRRALGGRLVGLVKRWLGHS